MLDKKEEETKKSSISDLHLTLLLLMKALAETDSSIMKMKCTTSVDIRKALG